MLALLFGLTLSPQLYSQWELHVRAGIGASRLNTELSLATGRDESQNVQIKPSWSLGVEASHPVANNLGISAGLALSAYHGINEYWVRDNLAQEQEWQLQYLYLPLLIRYYWRRIHIGAGYQCGLPLSGTTTFTDHNEWLGAGMADQRYSSNNIALFRMDIGVVAEAGVAISERFSADLRYYRGQADIKDHRDGIMAPLSPEQFTLGLNYRLLPKPKKAPAEPATPPPTAPEEH